MSGNNYNCFHYFIFFKIALAVKIVKTRESTKFKVRCSRYLHTLVVTDREKADKLRQSLPPGRKMFSCLRWAYFLHDLTSALVMIIVQQIHAHCTVLCLYCTVLYCVCNKAVC